MSINSGEAASEVSPLLSRQPNASTASTASDTSGATATSSSSSSTHSINSSPAAAACSPCTQNPLLPRSRILLDILTLSGPISATTVVEFLPQILIAALVGHCDPHTALPHGDGHTEGAVLTAFSLANLVYSTCAFSLVYGFICGLDSVAASSYGLTLKECQEEEEKKSTRNSCVSPCSQTGTPVFTRKISVTWGSPALRGMGGAHTPRLERSSTGTGTGTPKRYESTGATNVSTLQIPSALGRVRRSPSVPNLTLSTVPSVAGLQSLEERSAFGEWKRRPDEGIDGPDSDEEEDTEHTPHALSNDHSAQLHSQQLLQQHQRQMQQNHAHQPQYHFQQPHQHSLQLRHQNSTSSDEEPSSASARLYLDPYHHHARSTSSTPILHPFILPSVQIVQVPTPSASGRATPITPVAHMAKQEIAASPMTPGLEEFSLHWTSTKHATDASDSQQRNNIHPSSAEIEVPEPNCPPSLIDNELPSSFVGIWIRRCLMLELLVVSILIAALAFGTAPMLRALGEPSAAIDVASEYVFVASLGLPFVAIYHAFNKGLQSSGIVLPILAISFVTKSLSVIAVWYSLYVLHFTLISIAWILAVTIAAQAISVYIYMKWSGIVAAWWGSEDNLMLHPGDSGFWKEYMYGLYEYSVLAVPACAAILLEFFLFDLVGALAGVLPNPSVELSVHYILFTTTLASYMVFSGVSVSVSVTVGQKLCVPGESGNAKRSAVVGTTACLCISGMLIAFLVFFHDQVGQSLTSQPTLLARFTECVPVLIVYQSVDGLNCCSTQLLRTLGVQRYGVLLHFTTYYLIGMTVGWTLAFKFGLGVEGLWIGLCLGVGLNALIATTWLWTYADWEEQCRAAIERTTTLNDACAADKDYNSLSSSSSLNTSGTGLRSANMDDHGA